MPGSAIASYIAVTELGRFVVTDSIDIKKSICFRGQLSQGLCDGPVLFSKGPTPITKTLLHSLSSWPALVIQPSSPCSGRVVHLSECDYTYAYSFHYVISFISFTPEIPSIA